MNEYNIFIRTFNLYVILGGNDSFRSLSCKTIFLNPISSVSHFSTVKKRHPLFSASSSDSFSDFRPKHSHFTSAQHCNRFEIRCTQRRMSMYIILKYYVNLFARVHLWAYLYQLEIPDQTFNSFELLRTHFSIGVKICFEKLFHLRITKNVLYREMGVG